MIQVHDLYKSFRNVRAVQGVSFSAPDGQITGLLGPNGAGKTTTLKCLLGVVPFQGDIEVEGVPVQSRGKDARRQIGYVPQIPAVGEQDTCSDALSFIAELRSVGADRVGWALRMADLTADVCRVFKGFPDSRISAVTPGQVPVGEGVEGISHTPNQNQYQACDSPPRGQRRSLPQMTDPVEATQILIELLTDHR